MQQFRPDLTQIVCTHLARFLGDDAAAAPDLWHQFCTGGLHALTEWRCGVARLRVYRQQRQAVLDQTLAGLAVAQRQEIVRLLDQLEAAMHATGMTLPLLRLLRERPGSSFRKRFGRWLRDGSPAFHVYHRSRKRKRRDLLLPQKHMSLQEWAATTTDTAEGAADNPGVADELYPAASQPVLVAGSPQETLAGELTNRLGYERPVTRNMLVQLGRYGGVGLLVPTDLFGGIDPDILTYIRCIKLGRLPGSVPIAALHRQVCRYAANLTVEAPSLHLVQVIFNLIAKRRHWNAGIGRTVERVHRRKTRTGHPRLFQCWQVFALSIALPLVDDLKRSISQTCFVVVVVDPMIQRIMGCWASATPPGTNEVGLALFEAIWHPGWRDWWVRGIPEQITVAADLCAEIPESLQQAAAYLLADIAVSTTRLTVASLRQRKDPTDQVAMLWREGATFICEHAQKAAVTVAEAQAAFLAWCVAERWFPNHTIEPVPEDWVLTLPGETSPAVGWLLPATQMDDEHTSNNIPARVTTCMQHGHPLQYRRAPLMYAWATDTFIECRACQYLATLPA